MKVDLISQTPNALELLLLTKGRRLGQNLTMMEIINWDMKDKLEHMDYMKKTIKGSFEFVHYVFHIREVSRAFTHQLVRSRANAYMQESQRTVDARENGWVNPTGDENLEGAYKTAMGLYETLVDMGMEVQNARGVLPTNVCTEIFVSCSLRSLHDMSKTRLCKRTQGEYQDVFKQMAKQAIAVHPWAESLIGANCVQTGVCQFPNYKKCPVQKFTAEITKPMLDRIKMVHEATEHSANPIAKDGRTM